MNGIQRKLKGAPVKDTVTVPDGGYTVIRFVANNPGFWIFHCHIEFHVEVGMALVFKVGNYDQMPQLPRNFPDCSSFMPDQNENIHLTSIASRNLQFLFGLNILGVLVVLTIKLISG